MQMLIVLLIVVVVIAVAFVIWHFMRKGGRKRDALRLVQETDAESISMTQVGGRTRFEMPDEDERVIEVECIHRQEGLKYTLSCGNQPVLSCLRETDGSLYGDRRAFTAFGQIAMAFDSVCPIAAWARDPAGTGWKRQSRYLATNGNWQIEQVPDDNGSTIELCLGDDLRAMADSCESTQLRELWRRIMKTQAAPE